MNSITRQIMDSITDEKESEDAVVYASDVLTPEQHARVEALTLARLVLAGSPDGSDMLAERFSVQDLVDVAKWILYRVDPMEAYMAGAES